MNIQIYNEDCIAGAKKIADDSVRLAICDPPFGIGESSFDKHYSRKGDNVIDGYQEAPPDYLGWSQQWIKKIYRILAPNGSFYLIIGWTNLEYVLTAAREAGFNLVNHAVWKYNYGVNTKKKFVTSHYHILYYSKSKDPVFNTYCRFRFQDRDKKGGSLLYKDLEDVFVIDREFSHDEQINQNKLPKELIAKIIEYSSNPGDVVCDFFMGNFTTAYVALALGRKVCGFEINSNAFSYHMPLIEKVQFGCDVKPQPINELPENQGKEIDDAEMTMVYEDYLVLTVEGKTGKDASAILQVKYGRGKYAIGNIIKEMRERDKDGTITLNLQKRIRGDNVDLLDDVAEYIK